MGQNGFTTIACIHVKGDLSYWGYATERVSYINVEKRLEVMHSTSMQIHRQTHTERCFSRGDRQKNKHTQTCTHIIPILCGGASSTH